MVELHIKPGETEYEIVKNLIEGKWMRSGWKKFLPMDFKDELLLSRIPNGFKKKNISLKEHPFKEYSILEDQTIVLYDNKNTSNK